jgi:hypothetical protein
LTKVEKNRFLTERKQKKKGVRKKRVWKKIKKQISFYAKEIKLRMLIFLTCL